MAQAAVHGYTTAFAWAAGIFAVGALVAVSLFERGVTATEGSVEAVTAVALRTSGCQRRSRSSDSEPAGRFAVRGTVTLDPLPDGVALGRLDLGVEIGPLIGRKNGKAFAYPPCHDRSFFEAAAELGGDGEPTLLVQRVGELA